MRIFARNFYNNARDPEKEEQVRSCRSFVVDLERVKSRGLSTGRHCFHGVTPQVRRHPVTVPCR